MATEPWPWPLHRVVTLPDRMTPLPDGPHPSSRLTWVTAGTEGTGAEMGSGV